MEKLSQTTSLIPGNGPQRQVVGSLGTPTWGTGVSTLGKLANALCVLINYNALGLLPARPRLSREQQIYALNLSREDRVCPKGGRGPAKEEVKG